MKIKILALLSFLLFSFSAIYSQEIVKYNGVEIEKGRIVYKLSPVLKSYNGSDANINEFMAYTDLLQTIGATVPKQLYPNAYMPDSCENCVDIRNIHEIFYSENIPMSLVLKELRSFSFVEYAEPTYVEYPQYVPNDTDISSQWHMNTCKIYQAWDIHQGDTNVVIGITDSGFDIEHSDLVNQIKYNYADPVNFVDDDYDGYVDNFRGWDFGNSDNNPDLTNSSQHGTHVAGLASAEVDNSFAISGVGNKCKFIPIKIATEQGYLTRGYEGIIYAADQGCDIINASWGSTGSYSDYNLDVINYATFNRNALVIAAAGNSGKLENMYPASYRNALSVAGTMPGDQIWTIENSSSSSASSWGHYVDVAAPAADYKSLAANNGTTRMYGGTSFATPIVSGIAALVKSQYPNLSALEIGERIRATADDFYDISYNDPYLHLIGSGRVNALKAITDATTPSVRYVDYKVENKNGSYKFAPGDTIILTVTLKNYLADATNIYVSVTSESSFISPIKDNDLLTSISHNEELTKTFQFEIVETMPPDVNTLFKLTCTKGDYFGYEYLPVEFNPSYYNFTIGNLKGTSTADGSIAVMESYSNKVNGLAYKTNSSMIYNGSLLMYKPKNNTLANFDSHNDFQINSFPEVLAADSVDLLVKSGYSNSDWEIDVEQYIYGWNNKDVLIHEYNFSHELDSSLTNVRVGALIDWMIIHHNYSKIHYVDSLQLGYVYSVDPTTYYAGIMPLHYHSSGFYAIDETPGADTISIDDDLTDDEIRLLLTTEKHYSGIFAGYGSRVASVSSSYITEIPKDSTIVVRYAILAADSFTELVDLASEVKSNYVTDTTTKEPSSVPNILCQNQIECKLIDDKIQVKYEPQTTDITIELISICGVSLDSKKYSLAEQTGIAYFNASNLSKSIYFVVLNCANKQYLGKISVSK